MKLSKRLQAIADLIIKHKNGDSLADIGTDHAYLPCYLVEEGVIDYAYACDIASGPIKASIETIKLNNLENKVIPLLGSGMCPIRDKSVNMISICGMGGKLTIDILEETIKDMFFQGDISFNDEVYITNIRQKTSLQEALKSLQMNSRLLRWYSFPAVSQAVTNLKVQLSL